MGSGEDGTSFPRLHKAIVLAVKAHRGQDRLGEHALPYATHPFDVLTRLRYGAGVTDEDLLCAAALHDVLEETDVTYAEIEQKFGKRTAGFVREVTRHEPGPKDLEGLSEGAVWRLRTRILLGEIERMSDDAKRIKLADRCSNLAESLRTRTGAKLYRYVVQSRWILERIDRGLAPKLWDEIDGMIGQVSLPQEFAELSV